jgi:protein-disulfide isomerase
VPPKTGAPTKRSPAAEAAPKPSRLGFIMGGPALWTGIIRPWLGTVLRILVGVVFIVAGAQKVGDPAGFVRATRAYDATPEWLSKAIGYGLPYLEIGLGALLVVGFATRFAAIVAALLFIVFLIGIIQASARGLQLECGCFGGGGELAAGQQTAYGMDILRDIGLLIAALFVVLWPRTKYGVDDLVRAGGKDARTAPRVGPRRTKEAQRRLAALQVQRQKEASRRVQLASAGGAALLVAVGLIGVAVGANRVKAPVVVPAGAVGDSITVGKATAPVTVDLYEDFICPVCQQFEKTNGTTIAQLASSGQAKFRYHMLNFLSANSSPAGYSRRAANAGAAAEAAGHFTAFHKLLYDNQPAEGSAGLSNAQLISYGKKAGITAATFADAVNKGTYNGWVDQVTDNASKDNVTGTPTVKIGNKTISMKVNGQDGYPPDAATLKKAIADATPAKKK